MRTFCALFLPLFGSLLLNPKLAEASPNFVVGWGDNTAGEATGTPSFAFSNGTVIVTENRFSTGKVTIAGYELTDVIAIYASGGFSLALKSNGTVAGWGDNQGKRCLGMETPYPHRTNGFVAVKGDVLSNVVSAAAGISFGLALKTDGRVVAWGSSSQGELKVPSGLTNVTAIAAGAFHGLALKKDGSVACWGGGKDSFAGRSNIIAIAAARSWFWHDVALLSDGTIIEEGRPPGEETVAVGSTNILAIAAGYNHNLALKRDGTVFGWGANDGGQATGIPTSGGTRQSSGLVTLNGLVLADVTAISAGQEYSLALKKDGTVVAWGNHRFYRDVPQGLNGVVAISAGDGFCLAITTNANLSFPSETPK